MEGFNAMRKKKEMPDETKLDNAVEGIESLSESLPPMWFLPTGNLALDYIISGKVDGTGGYPVGTSELFGEPSSGKSLLLAKAIAEMQKLGHPTILADAEMRWDEDFAAIHEVDDLKLQKFYPETVEEFAVEITKILDRLDGRKALIVLDSLAILSTSKEMDDVEEGDIKADQGRKAQKIKAAVRATKGKVRKSGSILLVTNHVIANPGSYSKAKMTPGGGGVPFQANVRIELSTPTPLTLKDKDRPIGVELHAKITKNSVAPPFGECSMQLYWASGVSKYSGLLEVALDLGIIERRGAWNYWKDVSFQSVNFKDTIQDNPGILLDDRWSHPYWMEV